ncbi:MAG: PhoPQ-activated pathogenicity-related family protein [Armatimonadota bacterium]
MKKVLNCSILVIIALLMLSVMSTASTLSDYVNKPESVYKWEIVSSTANRDGSKTLIEMTSQTWQNIIWKHKIELFRPAKCKFPNTALLFITGNYHPNRSESMIGLQLALRSGCPVAVLYDVPNQPLYDGKSEDALIAYTLTKFLETGDKTWPLLLPMTKSAVQAMNTIDQYFAKKSGAKIEQFVVCGASKRGWTTWLTAAVEPVRVKGIMPMVYDNLNIKAQMKQQVISFGDYSSQINDYTELGLEKTLSTDAGISINNIIDPWSYRKSLVIPKLIINGTNDPYWPQDALNIYWNDLKGPKSVLYMVNSGHGLVNNDDTGSKIETLTNSMAVFTRSIASGDPTPVIKWKHVTKGNTSRLNIIAEPAKYSARMLVTTSATRDFRLSKWESVDMSAGKNGFSGTVELPKEGYKAVFGEASTVVNGMKYTNSTQIRILDSKGFVK